MVLKMEDSFDELDEATELILNKIASWLLEGSGWLVEAGLEHSINIASYLHLKGNSYIPLLPEELRNSKKGLINIKTVMTNALDDAIYGISTQSKTPLKEFH